jgi:CheY-like chemotaxis protein
MLLRGRLLVMAKAARILLVDDLDDVRESTAHVLSAAGYAVFTAANDEQAMSRLAEDPLFALLVTDIVLGTHANGFELAQRAVELQPNLKVLYTSGYTRNLEELYPPIPGSRVLRKPYRAHDLLREVDLLLDTPAPLVGAPDSTRPRAKAKPTILVVEDDDRSRGIAVDLFEGLGLRVLAAADAEDALKLLAKHPEISTLFTDIRLPGMTGDELAVEAQRMRPDLKVVLTSAYTDVSPLPGTQFVQKPWSTADFALVARSGTRH